MDTKEENGAAKSLIYYIPTSRSVYISRIESNWTTAVIHLEIEICTWNNQSYSAELVFVWWRDTMRITHALAMYFSYWTGLDITVLSLGTTIFLKMTLEETDFERYPAQKQFCVTQNSKRQAQHARPFAWK